MMNEKMIVVGGGIGGLTIALGMAKEKKSVIVLEQAPEFGEVGAGIQLAANATNVLQDLGVMDKIKEIGVFPNRLVLMDAFSGEELSALQLGEVYEKRYGAPYVVLHRSDLHKVLYDACAESEYIELVTNQQVKNVVDEGERVIVTSANGDVHEGTAIIGADGIWSEVRKQFVQDEAVCSKYVAYRGAIPTEEIGSDIGNLDDVYMWIGPNLHLVQYPVRKGKLYNQVVVFKSESYRPEIEQTDQWGSPEEMDKVFAGTCDRVQHAISFIQRQRRWPMYDRNPIDTWTKGNIALLGDAAHPMLQYLAQGACQAFEDAAYLTQQVKEKETLQEAFEAYAEERIPRASFVQTSARVWGEIIHAETPETILLRDTIMKSRDSLDFTYIDQFHGYKVEGK